MRLHRPALQCHHTHAADERQPYLEDGQRVFPSKKEAEYTASLAFGMQSLLPGGPPAWGWRSSTCPVSPFGNIGCRLIPEPSGSGQWHLQLSLWLRPTHPQKTARTPRRTRVVDVILEDKTLPPGVVYVGRGQHSHRLPVTKWSSPFVPGHNCDPSSWLPHSMWSASRSTWRGTFRS